MSFYLCACVCVLYCATHNDESRGWRQVGEGWQGSDLSDREIATWFKWLACSRQSLDRRVNWLFSYLQSNAAALTCPTQPRPDLSLSLSLPYICYVSLPLCHTHPCTHTGVLRHTAMETSTDEASYDHAIFWKLVKKKAFTLINVFFASLYQHLISHKKIL